MVMAARPPLRGEVHLVRLDPTLGSENPKDTAMPGRVA